MRILHILDERWDSAITAYGLILAEAQAARGHDVWVAAKPGLHADREARRRGLSVHPLTSFLGFRWFVGRKKFDVVNAHTGSGHTLGLWGVMGRPAALVRTRGDARPVDKRLGQKQLLERTGAVIAASRNIAGQYRSQFPFLEGRLHTIYPGMVIPEAAPEPSGPLRFALVGRLDPIKGQTYFIEALTHLKDDLSDAEFLIVGEPKNTTVGGLQRFAEKCGVSHRVRFLGRQPDVLSFMRS
jgi:glycosyltransferase involved in cell wall biosynthesis